MTTLTIRIQEHLKRKAFGQAEKLGVPLTLIITNALENFVKSPRIVIGEPEIMEVPLRIQKKMDKIASLLSNITVKNPKFQKVLEKNLNLIMSDLERGHYYEYNID